MGVYAYDKEVIPYLNRSINFGKGIYVAQIIKNGPASKTDLKEGDIITLIDGKELNTMNDLREYIYSKKPNDVVSIQISRGKINKTIEITLRKKIICNWDRLLCVIPIAFFFQIIFSYKIFCLRIIHKYRRTVLA